MRKKQGRLLIVEDNQNDILLLKRALTKCNIENSYKIITDGEKTISYLTNYLDKSIDPKISLILMDLKLPGKSGLEILDWIRQQPGLKRVPVIMFTCSRNGNDITKAYDLGVNSYLIKPVDFHSLLTMVKTLIPYWNDLNVQPELV